MFWRPDEQILTRTLLMARPTNPSYILGVGKRNCASPSSQEGEYDDHVPAQRPSSPDRRGHGAAAAAAGRRSQMERIPQRQSRLPRRAAGRANAVGANAVGIDRDPGSEREERSPDPHFRRL